MDKGTNPPKADPLIRLREEIKQLKKAVAQLQNTRVVTVPLYDPDNFRAVSAPGQIALADPDSSQPETAWAYDGVNDWWKIGDGVPPIPGSLQLFPGHITTPIASGNPSGTPQPCGVNWAYTPTGTGKVGFVIQAQVTTTGASNNTIRMDIGTGTPPGPFSGLPFGSLGISMQWHMHHDEETITLIGSNPGGALTVGVPYWFDLIVDGSSTITIGQAVGLAFEV